MLHAGANEPPPCMLIADGAIGAIVPRRHGVARGAVLATGQGCRVTCTRLFEAV
jgi:hypothetical protein